MKKIILSLFCLCNLAACQPHKVSQQVQQQHFICKSLIEGFLKTQNLNDYQFLSLAPSLTETAAQRIYQYRMSNERHMQMNLPNLQSIAFQCDQHSAAHFEILLIDQNHSLLSLMQLDLPQAASRQALTALQASK